jgi:hypothetical protein
VATLPASRNRQLEFLSPASGAAPCASTALTIVEGLRDLWFLPPDTLRVGTTWNDSAVVHSCRDNIPLRTVVQRSFRVRSADLTNGHIALTIVRESHTSLGGEGLQSGEPVRVSGSATGELVYVVDPSTGTILSGSGTATLQMQLASRLRNQNIRQTAAIQISAADPLRP